MTLLDHALAGDGARIVYRRRGATGARRHVLVHSLAMPSSVWADAIPGAALKVPDARHLAPIECLAAITDIIRGLGRS